MPPLASLPVITMHNAVVCILIWPPLQLQNNISISGRFFPCKMVLVTNFQVCDKSRLWKMYNLSYSVRASDADERREGLIWTYFIYLIRNRRDKVYRSKDKLVIALLTDLSQIKLCSCLRGFRRCSGGQQRGQIVSCVMMAVIDSVRYRVSKVFTPDYCCWPRVSQPRSWPRPHHGPGL